MAIKNMPVSSSPAIEVLRRKKQEGVQKLTVVISADLKIGEDKIKSIRGFSLTKRIGNAKGHSNWQGVLTLRYLESANSFKGVHEIRWTWHGRKA